MFSKGSKEWNHNLASPNSVRQNLWTFTSSSKQWAFIQSLEHSKCTSASSGFPENSGLKCDQFYINVTAPLPLDVDVVPVLVSGWVQLLLLPYLPYFLLTIFLICHILSLFLLSIPDVIILMLSYFNSSQMLEFIFRSYWQPHSFRYFPDKKPFSQFSFPFSSVWRILPSSNYGFPIVRWKFSFGISFFVSILRSWMSPHVMYGSAGCVSKS